MGRRLPSHRGVRSRCALIPPLGGVQAPAQREHPFASQTDFKSHDLFGRIGGQVDLG